MSTPAVPAGDGSVEVIQGYVAMSTTAGRPALFEASVRFDALGSDAGRATVTFDSTGRDRGRLEGATGATGLRLLGEFAAEAGGAFAIEPAPGGGTTIVLEVPQDGISHP